MRSGLGTRNRRWARNQRRAWCGARVSVRSRRGIGPVRSGRQPVGSPFTFTASVAVAIPAPTTVGVRLFAFAPRSTALGRGRGICANCTRSVGCIVRCARWLVTTPGVSPGPRFRFATARCGVRSSAGTCLVCPCAVLSHPLAILLGTVTGFRGAISDRSLGGPRGCVTGLPLQENPRSCESQRQYCPQQHQREAVDEWDRDVEQDVLQRGTRVFGEVLVRERHRDEQNQRRLNRCSEEPAVANQHDGCDDTDQIQARECRRQFGSAGRIDDETEKGCADGDRHCPPSRDAGDRSKS